MLKRDCWGRRWTRAKPERADELEITFDEHEERKAVQYGRMVPGLASRRFETTNGWCFQRVDGIVRHGFPWHPEGTLGRVRQVVAILDLEHRNRRFGNCTPSSPARNGGGNCELFR